MISPYVVNWIALIVLVVATAFEHYWVWGVVFLFWAVGSCYTREVFLLFPIERDKTPVLYWLVCVFWAGFGLWYLFTDILWRIGIYSVLGFDLYGGT